MGSAGIFERMAALTAYPSADFSLRAQQAMDALAALHPELAAGMSLLADYARAHTPEEMQELYTRTFDVNPPCAPEVGWHLYGENYARGNFLVGMREELRRHGIPEGSELPDHLSHVLALLDRLDEGEARRLALKFAAPALDKMLEGFAEKDNPYAALLRGVRALLSVRFAAKGEQSHV